jgi:tRNA threonylcarbamoyl adenosine modification protein YeaZ
MLLAIDTSAGTSVAVVDRERGILAQHDSDDTRRHAEVIGDLIAACLADSGIAVADLSGVVAGMGPGPFTGLRVGMATAAAFAHALGVPVHGVCSLDAIGVFTDGDALVVTDARRREVYWARYSDGVRVAGPAVNAPTDVAVDAEWIAGSAEHVALFDLPRLEHAHPTVLGLVRAADWTRDPEPLIPLYLRRPDAKPTSERAVRT